MAGREYISAAAEALCGYASRTGPVTALGLVERRMMDHARTMPAGTDLSSRMSERMQPSRTPHLLTGRAGEWNYRDLLCSFHNEGARASIQRGDIRYCSFTVRRSHDVRETNTREQTA